jgi:predicted phage tail protein
MSVATLREVRLYGQLGRQFGRVHYLAISTPAEAVRALCATLPGFKDFLIYQVGYGYKVIVDGSLRLVEALHDPFGKREVVKIVPIVGGAKSGGLGIILGAVIFAASTYFGFQPGMQLGAGLMLGGVVQLLSPQRRGGSEAKGTDNGLPSYAFNGAVNTTQQGLPVPLVYGRIMTGSAVISAGMTVDDISPPPPPPPPPPQPLPPEQSPYLLSPGDSGA